MSGWNQWQSENTELPGMKKFTPKKCLADDYEMIFLSNLL